MSAAVDPECWLDVDLKLPSKISLARMASSKFYNGTILKVKKNESLKQIRHSHKGWRDIIKGK